MIRAGEFHTLKVSRRVDFGFYLDDGKEGILLPKRFAPSRLQIGDEIEVFIYHDSENKLIATTQKPKAVAGNIAKLKVVSITPQGAFLDWGLMKDLFVPKSQQISGMRVGGEYLVKLYIDEQTGRIAATEKIENTLSNNELTVAEKEPVEIVVFRRTDIGYAVIINKQHLGLIHFSDVFKDLQPGEHLQGYIKRILPNNKIDVMPGKVGYQKVEDEASKILRLLQENNGYLPYHDKSDPEDIYAFFSMSKKTFKAATGSLYKEHKIDLTQTGIRLISD